MQQAVEVRILVPQPYVGLTVTAVAVAHTQCRTLQDAHKTPPQHSWCGGGVGNETYGVAVRVGVRDL